MKNYIILLMSILFAQYSHSQVQTDESDSKWTIVMPKYFSKDINMGKVIINNNKDSIVKNLVVNSGSYKFSIIDITITGQNKDDFSIVSGFTSFILDSNKGQDIEVRFSPKKTGVHNAKINFITKVDTLSINITGEGIEPQIQVLNNIIDFGVVRFGKLKDTIQVFTIKNIGKTTLTIKDTKHSLPNIIDFITLDGGGSFNILPGDSHKMNLRFKPSSLGRINGVLEFLYDGPGEKAKVQLFGIGKLLPNILNLSPICVGDDIFLSTDSIPNASYYWKGPDGFMSNNRNVVIKNAQEKHSGKYYLYVELEDIYSDTLEVDVLVNQYVVSPNDQSLAFKGSTERTDNSIKLTNSIANDYGAVWINEKFTFKGDFETTFEFSYKNGSNGPMKESSIPGADGIAFVIQNKYNPVLGSKGGNIGYTGITNSLAVELDLYRNEYDPNGNHLAVQSMGFDANLADHSVGKSLLGINTNIITIKQDSTYYIKIRYEWKNKQLKVYVNDYPTYENPQIVVTDLNLVEFIGLEDDEFGYVGITSATGSAHQEHIIRNWIVPCKNNTVSVGDVIYSDNYFMKVNPNPVEQIMNINLNFPTSENITLNLCDLNGSVIKTIVDGIPINPLQRTLNIDVSDLSNGMYFLKLQSQNFVDYQKVLILK